MSNLRDLAAADIKSITEDINGAGTPYILIDAENEYPVVGVFGDIGHLLDPETGEVIQGRAIEATVTSETILSLAGKIPARGWKARVTGLDKKEITLFVKRNEYDRTIGLCRLTLGLELEDENPEGEDGE